MTTADQASESDHGSSPAEHRWHLPDSYDKHARRIQERNATLLAKLHPQPDMVRRAYEIGCGTGTLTSALARELPNATIDALDISRQMLAVARAKVYSRPVRFSLGSFLDEVTAQQYDAVFSNAALHWLYPNYAEAFKKIRSMLVPDGLAFIAMAGRTAAADKFDALVESSTRDMLAGALGPPFSDRRLTPGDASRLGIAAGMSVDDIFLTERHVEMTATQYSEWWVASGGPWTARHPESERAIQALAARMGGTSGHLTVVHASVFMVISRPGVSVLIAGRCGGSCGPPRRRPSPSTR